MRMNDHGQYVPQADNDSCPQECGLCLSVCPFSPDGEDEDLLGRRHFAAVEGIHHLPQTGFHLACAAGYSRMADHRKQGASGGLGTWLCETLLKKGLVDRVLCVSPLGQDGKLCASVCCQSPQTVRACAGSCYHPVEFSGVLRMALTEPARYAIVALPCVCKGVRRSMQRMPRLAERITYVIGLVCGQTKSRQFAEAVCRTAGEEVSVMNRILFRTSEGGRDASDLRAKVWSRLAENGERTVSWTGRLYRYWRNRYFTPNACDFCDDVFAETADVALMDAWLPQFVRDPQGHSMVLVRHPDLLGLLRTGQTAGELDLNEVPVETVLANQRPVLAGKRRDIRVRIEMARSRGEPTPAKRTHLFGRRPWFGRRWLVRTMRKIALASAREWAACQGDLRKFERRMAGFERAARVARLLDRLAGRLAPGGRES